MLTATVTLLGSFLGGLLGSSIAYYCGYQQGRWQRGKLVRAQIEQEAFPRRIANYFDSRNLEPSGRLIFDLRRVLRWSGGV